MKWTCNPETGAIFDGKGTLIGVADKSSAASIVAMHNREMSAEDWVWSQEKGSRPTGVYTDETHVWRDKDSDNFRTRYFMNGEPIPPLWINETDYRPPSTT